MSSTDRPDYVDSHAETLEFTPDPPPDTIDQLPGLARIAASAAMHTAGWALHTSLSLSRRALQAATSPDEAARLVQDVRHGTESVLRDVIRLTTSNPPESVKPPAQRSSARAPQSQNGTVAAASPVVSLREQGEELMRNSRDVRYEVDA